MEQTTATKITQASKNKDLIPEVFASLNDARKKHEMRWYIVDNFDENNHFVKQMNQMGKLVPATFPKGVTIRPIPRAKKQISSLVNIVLSNDPKWNIYPRPVMDEFESEEAKQLFDQTAMRMSQWFEDLWYYLDVKDRVREMVGYGMKYHVGYAEIGVDGEGNIFIDTYEPYEIWHEPGIKSLKETSVLIKAVSRTLEYVRNAKSDENEIDPVTNQPTGKKKPLYDPVKTAKLQPEERLALSDWKNVRLKEQARGSMKQLTDPRIARVFLKEVWIKHEDHWDLSTECQGHVLRDECTDIKKLRFVAYTPDGGLLYAASPYEDLIPMNQSIDMLTAMVEGYARTTNVARLLKPKMGKVNRILNEHGEMIEYEGVQKPEWLPPGPSPVAAIDALRISQDLMDEVGTSVVSFGKVPAGVKAAEALENLKNIEYANTQTAVDCLSKTLEEMAEIILDIADQTFTNPVTVYHMDQGKPDFFKLVSSSNSIAAENPASDAIKVSSNFMVKVEIESGIAHTEQAKRDTIMGLFEKGLIPPDEVLKAHKFSNVEEIMSKTAEAKAAQVSIAETPEFNVLPPELRLQILEALGMDVNEQPKAA